MVIACGDEERWRSTRLLEAEVMVVSSNGEKAFYTVVTVIFKPVKKTLSKEMLFHLPLSH